MTNRQIAVSTPDASGTLVLIGVTLGMILTLIGSFLPLLEYEGEKVGGWDSGGLEFGIQSIAATAAVIGYAMTPSSNRWLLGAAFVLSVILLARSGAYAAQIEAEIVGDGLWLMLAGAILAVTASVVGFVLAERPMIPEMSEPEAEHPSED